MHIRAVLYRETIFCRTGSTYHIGFSTIFIQRDIITIVTDDDKVEKILEVGSGSGYVLELMSVICPKAK